MTSDIRTEPHRHHVVAVQDAGRLECLGCDEPGHVADDTDAMIAHLRVHQAYGDDVPMRLIRRLDHDRPWIDEVSEPHTCHEGPCALCDPEDERHPEHTPASVTAARLPD